MLDQLRVTSEAAGTEVWLAVSVNDGAEVVLPAGGGSPLPPELSLPPPPPQAAR